MNGMANNSDDSVECPLCMEPFEVDDLTFFPCTCGYQICRFCWHRIRTDENKLCPACRKEYPENPADFKPLSQEEMIAFKSQKRQRDQQRKQKITENRKHLANVRVVQKNLVFVVGLPPRLADADILKKHEYFGKYGKIHKVVINPSTTYAGVQGPSASAYVTYVHNQDALRAIQSVNNIMIDGRLIKTSLGTTKYCSHFMKNQQCPKGDCMYLHELGDPEASFTKEEMHQGKHQEYEKRLHDVLIATSGANSVTGIGGSTTNGGGTAAASGGSATSKAATAMSSSSSSSTSSVSIANNSTVTNSQQKEAWPSLSVSPVNSKETIASASGGSNGKSRKEKLRSEKTRHEKNKSKSKQTTTTSAFPSSNTSSSSSSNKENFVPDSSRGEAGTATAGTQVSLDEPPVPASASAGAASIKSEANGGSTRQRSERNKERGSFNRSAAAKAQRENNKETNTQTTITTTATSKQLEHSEEDVDTNKDISLLKSGSESSTTTTPIATTTTTSSTTQTTFPSPKRSSPSTAAHRSPSSSSENSDDRISESSTSGKSSPGNASNVESQEDIQNKNTIIPVQNGVHVVNTDAEDVTTSPVINIQETSNSDNGKIVDDLSKSSSQEDIEKNTPAENDHKNEVSDTLSKLDIFDDSNSFFSSSPSFQQSLLLNKKLEGDVRQPQMNNVTSSHLPDLLNGIDSYQKAVNTNEWEEAFKNVMIRNTRQVEEQVLQQQHLQLQQQHHHQQVLQQQEEFLRMHEFHKRNNLVNNMGIAHTNGLPADFPGHFPNSAVDANRTPQPHGPPPMQHQPPHLMQQQQPEENQLNMNNVFGGNMSKFFDFHKSQQQLHHQYMNGHSMLNNGDSHRLAVFLENSRVNPSLIDSGLLNQQSQVQKQRLLGAFDKITPQQQPQNTQSQQSRFSQNSLVDDDLGFDPFTETQKGLAELMENEVVQQNVNIGPKMPQPTPASHQQIIDNMHRARMPPPGFNHMNTLGFDGAARVHSSKILPFINMPGNTLGNNPAPPPVDPQQQHQIHQMATNWNNHMASLHQQQQHQGQPPLSDSHLQHQLAQAAAAATNQNKGYGNSDWTAMDPAILSFRQFSSFPHQGQMPPLHQQQQDLLLQHLAQNQQQNGQGFSNQSQQMLPGMNLPNNLINGQSSSQTQVNANVQGMLEFLKNRQFV